MYLLTYVGAMLNGLTLLILGWVGLFSLPRLYRDNKKQIDEAVLPLKSKLEELQVNLHYLLEHFIFYQQIKIKLFGPAAKLKSLRILDFL